MKLAELADALPAYAVDHTINLVALVNQATLTDGQRWGCILASAYASANPVLMSAAEADARDHLSGAEITAVRRAVSLMAMNAVYYRAVDLLRNHEYRSAPADISMTGLSDPGAPRIDFELWCVSAVSIAGCGSCLNALESELRKRGASFEAVQSAVRIAACLKAIGVTLELENQR